MIVDKEQRRLQLRGYLTSAFTSDYWKNFQDEFGHDFFNAHIERTLEYDEELNKIISHKTVLEVGGFPGLETAWLLNCHPDSIDIIDSPFYIPDYYSEWVNSIDADIHTYVHDITIGVPDIFGGFDIAIMSDVLLHIEGFPIDFMKWLCGAAKKIIIINYLGSDGNLNKATTHNLHVGYTIPSHNKIIEFMESNGAKLLQRKELKSNREMLIFEGNQ